jgi:hypothetical protein
MICGSVVDVPANCYILAMHRCFSAQKPRRIMLDDHRQLFWRFFGRLIAATPAEL